MAPEGQRPSRAELLGIVPKIRVWAISKVVFTFALSLSKGYSWFDKPVLRGTEGLTTNGVVNSPLLV
jgi:hypothetical protein